MSSKPHYFAIGLFVLISATLGMIGIVAVSSDAMRSSKYFIETYVDESVQGIDIGTPFKFRGVKVGNVSEIAMVSTIYDTSKMYVMIRVALEDRAVMEDQEVWQQQIREMIGEGLRLKLVPQGITGLSFLEADFFPEAEFEPVDIDWEPDYIYIPSTPAMMTLLSRSIERMAAEINSLNLKGIGQNVESITSNLNQSAIHVEQITRNAAEASGGIITNVSLAVDSLPEAGTNLVETIALVQGMILDSDQELDQIILNLRYITDETKELMRMIKRHPGMLLTEPPDKNLSDGGRK